MASSLPGKPGKDKKVIRIVKKKKHGHAHHGGSWKVAYADFVTAMMAFFMVMWILGMDDNMKNAIEGYFSNPVGFKKGFSAGSMVISNGNSPAGEQKPPLRVLIRAAEEQRYTQLASDIHEKINGTTELKLLGARIEAVKTKSGLRIELEAGLVSTIDGHPLPSARRPGPEGFPAPFGKGPDGPVRTRLPTSPDGYPST